MSDEKTTNKLELGDFASIVTVYIAIISVIYANGVYDLWDVLIAGLIIFFTYKYDLELFKNSISRNLTLFSLAIACAVCLLSLEYIIGSKEGYYFFDSIRESIFNSAGCQLSHFFDFEFLLSGFIFFLFSLIWHLPYIYKRLKAK